MPTTNFYNELLSNELLNAKTEKETNYETRRQKSYECVYKTNDSGFYNKQLVKYILPNIINNGELVETNDTTKTFRFTNKDDETKTHIINISAFNNSASIYEFLENKGIKGVIEVLGVQDNGKTIKLITKTSGIKFETIIKAENGKLVRYDNELKDDIANYTKI